MSFLLSLIFLRRIACLKKQCKSSDEGVQRLVKLVLEIAHIKPHKRNRIKFLARNHPDLLAELEATERYT